MTTVAPFLYPFRKSELRAASKFACQFLIPSTRTSNRQPWRTYSTSTEAASIQQHGHSDAAPGTSRLNPSPDDYNITPFVDKCVFTVEAGSGGHGCVSFLREKYIAEGPANGGDGGTGGNVFIQAVKGCSSLNQISKKREYKAGRGHNGQGSSMGGRKGDDLLLEVPVGTVVREIKRWDPVEVWMDLERRNKFAKGEDDNVARKLAERWLLYPGLSAKGAKGIDINSVKLPPVKRTTLAALEPTFPIRLDLDEHMDKPLLLAAGSIGGQGNPHFASGDLHRPQMGTKGISGKRIALAIELKLVADVGLVGLPNAGKSTLLRVVSRSRARVGSWAFTTLQPNIGTVMLDDNTGRPRHYSPASDGNEPRTSFTIADIPGIIQEAHLNKGLGLDFLRHIERAQILAFVVDLSQGDAVAALAALWREVGEYKLIKDAEHLRHAQRRVTWDPFAGPSDDAFTAGVSFRDADALGPLELPPITSKPWFVIGTKADLPGTEQNFLRLQDYVRKIETGLVEHPSGTAASRKGACAIPVSGREGQGTDKIVDYIMTVLR